MTNKTILGIFMACAWTLTILAFYAHAPLMFIWGAVCCYFSTRLYYTYKEG